MGYTKKDAIDLLTGKAGELESCGEKRYPKRSDFTSDEVNTIKAFLGPWPRALEAAGLKEERDGERLKKNREKRIRAKRNRIEALKNQSKPQKNV